MKEELDKLVGHTVVILTTRATLYGRLQKGTSLYCVRSVGKFVCKFWAEDVAYIADNEITLKQVV